MEPMAGQNALYETRDMQSLSYMLPSPEMLFATGYKVMQNQTSANLLPCVRVQHNGRDKLVYDISRYSSLDALLPSLYPESFLTVVANLLSVVAYVWNIGFIQVGNIETGLDKIFVDSGSLSVHLVYLPIVIPHAAELEKSFEARLKTNLFTAIQQHANLQAQATWPLYNALYDPTSSLAQIRKMLAPAQPQGDANTWQQASSGRHTSENFSATSGELHTAATPAASAQLSGSGSMGAAPAATAQGMAAPGMPAMPGYAPMAQPAYAAPSPQGYAPPAGPGYQMPGGNAPVQEAPPAPGGPAAKPAKQTKPPKPPKEPKQKSGGLFGRKQKQAPANGGFSSDVDGGDTEVLGDMFVPTIVFVGVQTPQPVQFLIAKPEFLIGKNAAAVDGSLAFNNAISRSHCKICFQNGQSMLVDLGSANGTFLNGKKLDANAPTPIKPGDKVKLANSNFSIQSI